MLDTAGSPERARWFHLARSGSQSQRAIWFILPARGASHLISLVIASDRVRVIIIVVIRSAGRYYQVKKKTNGVGGRILIPLKKPSLWCSENYIVRIGSGNEKINQSQCFISDLVIGWFFCVCFWLRQSCFHLIISDGVVGGIGRNGNVLILPTSDPLSL